MCPVSVSIVQLNSDIASLYSPPLFNPQLDNGHNVFSMDREQCGHQLCRDDSADLTMQINLLCKCCCTKKYTQKSRGGF